MRRENAGNIQFPKSRISPVVRWRQPVSSNPVRDRAITPSSPVLSHSSDREVPPFAKFRVRDKFARLRENGGSISYPYSGLIKLNVSRRFLAWVYSKCPPFEYYYNNLFILLKHTSAYILFYGLVLFIISALFFFDNCYFTRLNRNTFLLILITLFTSLRHKLC